jgi:hypothetical protein
LNQPDSGHRKIFDRAAWGIVLLVLAHLCWLQLRPGSPFHQAYGLATKPASARVPTRPSGPFDQLAREAGDASVLLELAGPARTNRVFENSLGYFYFQANYVLYPRRLYAAPAGQVINNGADVMHAGFNPDRQWLQDHNVRSVLTYDGDHAGEPPPHLKILQPDQRETGMQTNAMKGSLPALPACGFYLLLITLVGYGVVSAIHPSRQMSAVQLTTLSAAVGAGAMGLLLFWASLAGFAPSRNLLSVIACVALAGLFALKKKKRLVMVKACPGRWEKGDGWAAIPATLTLLALGVVLAGSLSTPLQEWDAFAIWGLKAKVLAHAALRPIPPYFHDLSLSYSHLDYPLMMPFLTAGAYAAMGGVDDQAGKLVSVFLDVLVVPVIYLGLRWKLRRPPAAFLTAILALLPAMFRYGGTGCADLPLAMFYAGSIFYLAKWLAEPQWPNLALAILFSTFAAFTKNEGAVLALANGAVILGFGLWRGRRRHRIGAVAFFAGLLLLNAAWLIWNHSLPRTHEDYGSKLLSPLLAAHLPRLKQIIPEMLVQATNPQAWGLLWILAGMVALSGWRAMAQRYLLAVWILLAMHLASYVLAYVVTPWNLNVLMPATMDRLLLHTAPAVFLLAGWHWAEAGKSWRT